MGFWLFCAAMCLLVPAVQLVVMVATIFPVEKALKRNFDEFGRRIG